MKESINTDSQMDVGLPHNSTNLRNRVSKLYLPKTKPLLPLFEIISNSIHAIQERRKIESEFSGKITIRAIRYGNEDIFKETEDIIEKFPIVSFEVTDNGIGLNEDNFKSFAEFDSEKKAEIGGKGIGRLVSLKAFKQLLYNSIYLEDGNYKQRKFIYEKSKEGFGKYYNELAPNLKKIGTTVLLDSYEDIYKKQVPLNILEIARQIITHFQLYFIQKLEPEIIIMNQNGTEVHLSNLFNREFEKKVLDKNFEVSNQEFRIFIAKSFMAKSHKLHYCAHEREVKDEGLSKYLEDLKFKIIEDGHEEYFFQVFVVGEFLNKNVNESRTSFNFSLEEDQDEIDLEEITLSKIRKKAIACIEDLLSDLLATLRQEKMKVYYPIIKKEFPNYHSVVNFNKEKVEKLPSGLTKEQLDLKLYEIEAEWKIKVKAEGVSLIEKKKDITELGEYKELYERFLTEFNEIGLSELGRYVVHRRSVIDLLDKLIELNENDKFSDEEIIHSLFFPIRETSLSVTSDKQNLWLLDERLTFNSLLASDKLFKQVKELNSESSDRIDLIIRKEEVFESATLFSEDRYPFESFTIVEFKKPARNDYQYGIVEKDPVRQVRKYIREILDGKIKKQGGRKIEANERTPFYCYIIADITSSLKYILTEEGFTLTPDGLGYFNFYDSNSYLYKAYIEVLPFEKVIKDAKQRNKILFDKLNLS